MGICKVINGITENTSKHLLLDAGAFFKNYNVSTDTYESAKKAKKLLGATKGGGSFKATPTIRSIEVDGARGKVKGMDIIDSWETILEANLIETTKDTVALGLGIANIGEVDEQGYVKITPKSCIKDEDYIENITWVGTLSGSDKPVIIQIYNALNTAGIELKLEDKSEGVIPLKFNAYVTADENGDLTSPFAIYYPNEVA